jgi:hypothetical protein
MGLAAQRSAATGQGIAFENGSSPVSNDYLAKSQPNLTAHLEAAGQNRHQ